MKWTPGGTSGDIEDRRDDSGGGGGITGIHLGIGGTIIVGLLSLIFHQNLFQVFSGGSPATPDAGYGAGPARGRRGKVRFLRAGRCAEKLGPHPARAGARALSPRETRPVP